MGEFNLLYRKRVGLDNDKNLQFEDLNEVLEKSALAFPFENLSIILNQRYKIDKESLTKKLLLEKRGGLCYELNPILYLFLKENGFKVKLTKATVFDNDKQEWVETGDTHIVIILNHEGNNYLLDIGFGVQVPLKPLLFSNGQVLAKTGEFELKKEDTKFGYFLLKMKLFHRDKEWKIGYAFNSSKECGLKELNEIDEIIATSKASNFNKSKIIVKLFDFGHINLSEENLTIVKNGTISKVKIKKEEFASLAKKYFNIS